MRSLRQRLDALQPDTTSAVVAKPTGSDLSHLGPVRSHTTHLGEATLFEYRLNETDSAPRLDSVLPEVMQFFSSSGPVANIKHDDLLFLDTETTGLSGGTGTHAFLIGLGFFEDGDLVIQQFFLQEMHQEPALLRAVRDIVQRHPVLVSFNGKSFDWPIVESRSILHGFRDPIDHVHIDLLHPSRRLWKRRLLSCTLSSLERALFGIERTDDIPGYLIPQVFFDYARTGNTGQMRSVLTHNKYDVELMVKLTTLLGDAVREPERALVHSIDRIGLCTLFIDRGEIERAIHVLNTVAEDPRLPEEAKFEALITLSTQLKRHGRKPEAVRIWEQLAAALTRRNRSVEPFIELAKHYEHDVGDFTTARGYVERALWICEVWGNRRLEAELQHRWRRLTRRAVTQYQDQRIDGNHG